MQNHRPLLSTRDPNNLNAAAQTVCLGLRAFFGVVGLSNQAQVRNASMGFPVCQNFMVKGNEADQSFGKSLCSFSNLVEKVPQTLALELVSLLQKDDNEEEVLGEEDLVEAQITWDIGETFGFKVSNKKAMIVTLAKVHECQDWFYQEKEVVPERLKPVLGIDGFGGVVDYRRWCWGD